jgi:hypothetical protein
MSPSLDVVFIVAMMVMVITILPSNAPYFVRAFLASLVGAGAEGFERKTFKIETR